MAVSASFEYRVGLALLLAGGRALGGTDLFVAPGEPSVGGSDLKAPSKPLPIISTSLLSEPALKPEILLYWVPCVIGLIDVVVVVPVLLDELLDLTEIGRAGPSSTKHPVSVTGPAIVIRCSEGFASRQITTLSNP